MYEDVSHFSLRYCNYVLLSAYLRRVDGAASLLDALTALAHVADSHSKSSVIVHKPREGVLSVGRNRGVVAHILPETCQALTKSKTICNCSLQKIEMCNCVEAQDKASTEGRNRKTIALDCSESGSWTLKTKKRQPQEPMNRNEEVLLVTALSLEIIRQWLQQDDSLFKHVVAGGLFIVPVHYSNEHDVFDLWLEFANRFDRTLAYQSIQTKAAAVQYSGVPWTASTHMFENGTSCMLNNRKILAGCGTFHKHTNTLQTACLLRCFFHHSSCNAQGVGLFGGCDNPCHWVSNRDGATFWEGKSVDTGGSRLVRDLLCAFHRLTLRQPVSDDDAQMLRCSLKYFYGTNTPPWAARHVQSIAKMLLEVPGFSEQTAAKSASQSDKNSNACEGMVAKKARKVEERPVNAEPWVEVFHCPTCDFQGSFHDVRIHQKSCREHLAPKTSTQGQGGFRPRLSTGAKSEEEDAWKEDFCCPGCDFRGTFNSVRKHQLVCRFHASPRAQDEGGAHEETSREEVQNRKKCYLQ